MLKEAALQLLTASHKYLATCVSPNTAYNPRDHVSSRCVAKLFAFLSKCNLCSMLLDGQSVLEDAGACAGPNQRRFAFERSQLSWVALYADHAVPYISYLPIQRRCDISKLRAAETEA